MSNKSIGGRKMSLLCKLGSHDWVTKEKDGTYYEACFRCGKSKTAKEKKEKSEDDS